MTKIHLIKLIVSSSDFLVFFDQKIVSRTNNKCYFRKNMSKPKHILVIRFSAMGDVALTIPALLSVVETHPEVSITFISRPFYASFIPSHPRIKSVGIDVDKYKGFLGIKKLANELITEHKFDEVIDLHNVLRTRLLSSFLKLRGKKITTFKALSLNVADLFDRVVYWDRCL